MIISKYLNDKSSLFVKIYSLSLSYNQTPSNNFNSININTVTYSATAAIDRKFSVEINHEKNYILSVSS